jgi:hypothetical protein
MLKFGKLKAEIQTRGRRSVGGRWGKQKLKLEPRNTKNAKLISAKPFVYFEYFAVPLTAVFKIKLP